MVLNLCPLSCSMVLMEWSFSIPQVCYNRTMIVSYAFFFLLLVLEFLVSFDIKWYFQVLLNILDSPLNKAGRLRAVYIKTEKSVLIEVKPYVRIPRTFKRFSGVMCKIKLFYSLSYSYHVICAGPSFGGNEISSLSLLTFATLQWNCFKN